MRAPWIGLALALLAAPAAALVVEGADPGRSERPPRDDPGWAHVGRRGSTSAVYLGEGWVLTARHAHVGAVELDGVRYSPVEGMYWLETPFAERKADLMLFRIDPAPPLPALAIADDPPVPGDRVVMVGYGAGRGEPIRFGGRRGYRWGPAGVKRWGTNRVSGVVETVGPRETLTQCFRTEFGLDTPREAQAAVGDSGGAVFTRRGGRWLLAGVMISIAQHPGQEERSAAFGNRTNAADLSVYRAQIEAVMRGETEPDPEPPPRREKEPPPAD